MKLIFSFIVSLALLMVGRAACLVAQEPAKNAPQPAKAETSIAKLIVDLVDSNFAVRQSATKQLRLRAKEAAPELLKAAAESNDREIREEAGKLAEQILWPKDEITAKKQLAKLPELMKNRQIDLVIETLVYWRDFTDRETLKLIISFAYSLAEEFEKETKVKLPRPTLGRTQWERGETLVHNNVSTVILAEMLESRRRILNVLIVSAMRIRFGDISGSIVFANSGMQPSGISQSILFVNGDLNIENGDGGGPGVIQSSLIICTGTVTTCCATKSVVLALGKIVNGSKDPAGSHLEPNAEERFKRIPLVNPSSLGFALRSEKKTTIIAELNNTPKKRSDLLVGDEVLAINDKRVDSIDTAMRHIRRSVITGTNVTIVAVIRKGEVLCLPINCD